MNVKACYMSEIPQCPKIGRWIYSIVADESISDFILRVGKLNEMAIDDKMDLLASMKRLEIQASPEDAYICVYHGG